MVQPAHESRDEKDELYETYLRVPAHLHAEIVRATLYVMPRLAGVHRTQT